MSSTGVHMYGASALAPVHVRSHLRITRRGRVALTVLAAAPLVAAAVFFGVNSGGALAGDATVSSSQGSVQFQHVTVRAGQSLWQIAETLAPKADPRDVVAAIVDLNQLQSAVVTPGQHLAVPPQYAGR